MWSHEKLEKMYSGRMVKSAFGTGETGRIIGSRNTAITVGLDNAVLVVIRDSDQKEILLDPMDIGSIVDIIDDPEEENQLSYNDVEYSTDHHPDVWFSTNDAALDSWVSGDFSPIYKFRDSHTTQPVSREEFIEIANRYMAEMNYSEPGTLTYHDIQAMNPFLQEWSSILEDSMDLWLADSFHPGHVFRIKSTGELVSREEFMRIIRRF